MRTSSVSAKAHNAAAKKLRELADEIGTSKVADKLGKHISHISHVLAGRRTMSEEVCIAVLALHEKTFASRTVEQVTKVIEAPKSETEPQKRYRGRQPSASRELQRQAIDKLKELNATVGLKAVAPKLGRAYATLYAGMREAQNMGVELCEAIVNFDASTLESKAIADTPAKTRAPAKEKEAAAPKGFTASRSSQLNMWNGRLSKDQAERIQVISSYVARKIGRGRDSFNGYSIEDLEQAGVVRCVEAAKRFDPNVSQFNTFFNIAASSGIRDFIREIDVLSRSERAKVKSGAVENDIKVIHIEDVFSNNASKNNSIGDAESFQVPFEDEAPKHYEDAELLEAIIQEANLTDDEALALDMHKMDMQQKEIGKLFGFSESRASQVIMSIIEKLIMAKNRMVVRESDIQNS